MAETHLWMFIIPFAANLWWTKSWLMDPIVSRWRFAVAALSGAILWVALSFAATRVVTTSGGVTIVHESQALAWFAGFMALISVVGLFLGLFLWAEEEAEETQRVMPESSTLGWGD